MSKHKRLKAARRKQHNKSAKARNLEWLDLCAKRRQEAELRQAQLIADAAKDTAISEPLPPTDLFANLLEGCLDGAGLPVNLYHPNGVLDVFKMVQRVQHLGGVSFIDTEGTLKYPQAENKDGSTSA